MTGQVTDNAEGSRFEMAVAGGGTAFAAYRMLSPTVVAITHVEVPAAVEGRGHGSAVMRGALDLIRAGGRKVRPYCSFAAAFLQRHPEYHDLLD